MSIFINNPILTQNMSSIKPDDARKKIISSLLSSPAKDQFSKLVDELWRDLLSKNESISIDSEDNFIRRLG